MTEIDRRALLRRLEPWRLVAGSLLETVIKAYGAAAAVSVAVSDSETVGGKSRDALAAVPTLVNEYRDAKYVIDHREEIQGAIDYLDQNTPSRPELEEAAAEGTETLRGIETTYSEVGDAKDAAADADFLEAFGHVREAWGARPDLESIRQLVDIAEQVSPLADEVGVLIPVYYGTLSAVTDNFASDEIVGTVTVMVLAWGIAVVVARSVGFWVRRGQPGLISMALQRLGAHVFRPWYVENLPFALGAPLHDAARERLHRDIVVDPQQALDPETFRELERYFAERASAQSGSRVE